MSLNDSEFPPRPPDPWGDPDREDFAWGLKRVLLLGSSVHAVALLLTLLNGKDTGGLALFLIIGSPVLAWVTTLIILLSVKGQAKLGAVVGAVLFSGLWILTLTMVCQSRR